MRQIILLMGLILAGTIFAAAQGNAFSFQGRLNDGASPANGRYDLEFKLFDALAGGAQIGPVVARPNTVLINGVFSVVLDFGAQAFTNPNAIFIEISVKPNGGPNPPIVLGPRQQLTVVPFASRAQNSTNADNAATAQNSLRLGSVLAGEYVTRTEGGADFIRNSTLTQSGSNFNISGNGTINGNLSVGGSQSLAGNQTVAGVSNLGPVNITANVTQSRAPFGLPKAMLYVAANGSITRCYNGVTGASTGNCGFTAQRDSIGNYLINFGFSIADKFYAITPRLGDLANNIGVMFRPGNEFSGTLQPNALYVRVFFTDVESNLSGADNPFMVIVY